MKIAICLLALLAATTYGTATITAVTAISFTAKYTNMSTLALSTCAVNASVAFTGTITSADSLEIWLVGTQVITTLTVGDHAMYFQCAVTTASTCTGSFLDITTAAAFTGSWAASANTTSGSITVTSAATTSTTTNLVYQIASVPYGAFDEAWNSTYKAKAGVAGVVALWRYTAAGNAPGATVNTPATA